MNKTTNINQKEIENAVNVIFDYGKEILAESKDEVDFGWVELVVGNYVYFRTYDDCNDNLTISKGEIIEVITSDKKVMNKPDDKMQSDGWHIERGVSYKVRWNGMTTVIDSRYVYTNKLHALIAAVNGTIKSYFDVL